MCGIFDSHCHLTSDEYNESEIYKIIKDAKIIGVTRLNNVGYDINSSLNAVNQALEYDNVYATIGIHPTDVRRHSLSDLNRLNELANNDKVIAIGEIGLDFYHKNVSSEIQIDWFIKQLKIAKIHNLPVVIHCRDAYEECYNILVREEIEYGVIHCYSGSLEMAQKFISLGLYVSFAGNITFKNSKDLQNVVSKISLSKILVETDAPYLAPSPYRGKCNYPKFIIYTIRKLAEIKKIPYNEVVRVTERNACNIFLDNKNKKQKINTA